MRYSQFREHAHIMRKSTYAIFDLETGEAVIGERINTTNRLESLPVRGWGGAALALVWHVVRLPVLLLLVILEPVIALLCGGLALLGILTTIFFAAIHAPHFPVWTMMLLSLGVMLVLIFYEGLIRVLSD
jgi:hypothetical protein